MVSFNLLHYNGCGMRKTIRCTLAVDAGLTDTFDEGGIVGEADRLRMADLDSRYTTD